MTQRDQLEALCKRVEKLKKQHRPIPTLETPGFVLIGRPYDPDAQHWADPPEPRRFTGAECVQIALIGALLTVCTAAAAVYLVRPL